MSQQPLPLYSIIICSGNQLYSGTGRVIFDWISFAQEEFRFEIVMDGLDTNNFNIAKEFCESHGHGFAPLRSRPLPGAPDPGLQGVSDYLDRRQPSVVEIHSWANAATNFAVLEGIKDGVTLVFTPHTQPAWTIPDHERFYLLRPTFGLALRRADIVCCLSPAELEYLTAEFGSQPGYRLIGNGVDTAVFRPMAQPKSIGVLSISDFRETRKRSDLLFRAFEQVVLADPTVRFTIAGRGSQDVDLARSLRKPTNALGYVPSDTLVSLYRSAEVFVLLSDFEAFGIPVAEALCCGTPVVINRTKEMAGIFGHLPGVVLVDNKDAEACSAAILASRSIPPQQRPVIAAAAAEQFSFDAVYGAKRAFLRDLGRSKETAGAVA